MRRSSRALRAVLAACLVAGSAGVGVAHMGPARAAADPPAVDPGPTPRAQCGPGSKPETSAQGRAPAADFKNGRAAKGYTCNLELIGRHGATGGFRVYRYIDQARHECAFYDTAVFFPTNLLLQPPGKSPGVFVLDMSDPRHPVQTATLSTPAMVSPHESLSLNLERGLLAADMGNALTYPGWVDVYDVSKDCRHPQLKSSSPVGILGHEGTFSPDGNTFWVSSTGGHTVTAVDVTNPSLPVPIWLGTQWVAHGMNVSNDGNRLYIADIADFGTGAGLTILDVSQVQQRKPNPQVKVVSHISWPEVSIPQTAIPVTIAGHPYLVEVDEFTRQGNSAPDAKVGAARVIDIGDDTKPRVVSNLRLEVNMVKNRAGDQQNDPMGNGGFFGGNSGILGYAAHYCAVPQRAEPGIVACSFMASGMRVFDIRDPFHPKELAYANFPVTSYRGPTPPSWAVSAPAFVPERGEIWYSDGFSGLYVTRALNGVWPFPPATSAAKAARPQTSVLGETRSRPAPSAAPSAAPAQLAVTGGPAWGGGAMVVLALGLGLRLLRHRPS
ncbi:MAG: hypothetical protein JWP02_231 [Acidimicrobiales bacterium]|nr:hypothetical protein [Acidimicrobiales bacterium]